MLAVCAPRSFGHFAFQEGIALGGMPADKRVVEEAVARAKERAAKVMRMMMPSDSVPEPYHGVITCVRFRTTNVFLLLQSLARSLIEMLRFRCSSEKPRTNWI